MQSRDVTGYHATALPDRWELRDASGRLVAAGRADGIVDALRWVASLTGAESAKHGSLPQVATP